MAFQLSTRVANEKKPKFAPNVSPKDSAKRYFVTIGKSRHHCSSPDIVKTDFDDEYSNTQTVEGCVSILLVR